MAGVQLKGTTAVNTHIKRTINEDHICHLVFDRPDSSANIFDRETLEELDQHLQEVEKDPSLKGLVISSAKPSIFIAGADLYSLTKDRTPEAFRTIIELGQNVFQRLHKLPIVTVAAIHGASPGGACELALACDYRIASTDRKTKIGLPEVKLGILPGWGGTSRLPRLLGLPKALKIILSGTLYPAKKAKHLGLINAIVNRGILLTVAEKWLSKGKHKGTKRGPGTHWPLNAFIRKKALSATLAKTKGNYPALEKALEITCQGAKGTLDEALKREKETFIELAMTPECEQLMNVFFLQERAKKTTLHHEATPLTHPYIIGAGVMGAGIAQWLASRGFTVILKDISHEALGKGMTTIRKLFSAATKRGIMSPLEAQQASDHITPVSQEIPLHRTDIVIEAAVEKLELKQAIFKDLETRTSPDTLLATNTSALSIEAIASGLKHPERFLGIHFFNPVHRMQLVELIRGPKTDERTMASALSFVKKMGKLPVIVCDSPGFLVNRILLPYMIEAVRLFQAGAPTTLVDDTMLKFGMPMGPLRLIDEVGLDVSQHVAADLQARLKNPVPIDETLVNMIANGLLGRKNGKGFYRHEGKKSYPNPDAEKYRRDHQVPDEEEIRDRLILLTVNEAARCLEENVVHSPEDIDFGMIMGTSWAPFRGGPCHYADHRGIPEIITRLESLSQSVAPHFRPADYLRNHTTFYGATPTKPKPITAESLVA